MNSRTPLVLGASAGALTLALAVPAAAAPGVSADSAAGDGKAAVSVFHGVPGLTVDVYADGARLLDDFTPGTVGEPRPLDAGTYDIQVYPGDQGPDDGTPAVQKKIEVPAGASATIAAHLSADGKPQLTAFVEDETRLDAGKAGLTVRHVAAAPSVDVRADGKPVLTALENPQQATATTDAGTVSADVVFAGTGTVAIGPADLNLEEGTSTVVYAWGSAADKNLGLATQTLGGRESAPDAVHAGGAPVASGSAAQWPAAAFVAGTAAVAGALAVRRTATRRG
ncbi:DUF4397 domain-containing protein [Streptomyces sp. NPDC052644]